MAADFRSLPPASQIEALVRLAHELTIVGRDTYDASSPACGIRIGFGLSTKFNTVSPVTCWPSWRLIRAATRMKCLPRSSSNRMTLIGKSLWRSFGVFPRRPWSKRLFERERGVGNSFSSGGGKQLCEIILDPFVAISRPGGGVPWPFWKPRPSRAARWADRRGPAVNRGGGRRGVRTPWPQRCRQDHHDQDSDRSLFNENARESVLRGDPRDHRSIEKIRRRVTPWPWQQHLFAIGVPKVPPYSVDWRLDVTPTEACAGPQSLDRRPCPRYAAGVASGRGPRSR